MVSAEDSRENDEKLTETNGFDSLGEFISRRKVTAPKGTLIAICEGTQ